LLFFCSDPAPPAISPLSLHDALPISTYSYADVLNNRLPPTSLQGKILFVGATAAGLGDFLPTPLSGLAAPMPGVEVHAAIFQGRSEEHTSELQSRENLVCRLLLEKKK